MTDKGETEGSKRFKLIGETVHFSTVYSDGNDHLVRVRNSYFSLTVQFIYHLLSFLWIIHFGSVDIWLTLILFLSETIIAKWRLRVKSRTDSFQGLNISLYWLVNVPFSPHIVIICKPLPVHAAYLQLFLFYDFRFQLDERARAFFLSSFSFLNNCLRFDKIRRSWAKLNDN